MLTRRLGSISSSPSDCRGLSDSHTPQQSCPHDAAGPDHRSHSTAWREGWGVLAHRTGKTLFLDGDVARGSAKQINQSACIRKPWLYKLFFKELSSYLHVCMIGGLKGIIQGCGALSLTTICVVTLRVNNPLIPANQLKVHPHVYPATQRPLSRLN